MPTAGISCPWCCQAIDAAGLAAGSRVRCPRCRAAFTLRPEDLRAAAVAARIAPKPAAPPPPDPGGTVSGRTLLVIGAGAAGALLLVAGVIVAVILAGKRPTPVAAAPPAPQRPTPPALPATSDPPEVPLPPADAPRKPIADNTPPPPVKPPHPPDAPPPPIPPPLNPAPPDLKPDAPPAPRMADLPPELQDKVNKAIDQGVAFLKKSQKPDGSWTTSQFFLDGFPVGHTALCGLTLLECGVPADDPHVTKAAAFVRQGAPQVEKTYELSLAILFLDRLADSGDEATIRTCALRLTAGQTTLGGWTYSCPVLQPQAEAKLLAGLEKAGPGAVAAVEKGAFDVNTPDGADNSNTQFAILGMWTARRHGVPTDGVLARVNRRFRASQTPDGRWGYTIAERTAQDLSAETTPSMTAAGLLGLAVGRVVDSDQKADAARPDGDAAIDKGMKALGAVIGGPQKMGDIVIRQMPTVAAAIQAEAQNAPDVGIGTIDAKALGVALDLYFLWSVERVGVLFNRATIGGKEWYPWGARLLVDGQNGDGGWGRGGSFISTPTVDTCFALLFLKRANLARDLSTKLEFLTQIEKPIGTTTTKPSGELGPTVPKP